MYALKQKKEDQIKIYNTHTKQQQERKLLIKKKKVIVVLLYVWGLPFGQNEDELALLGKIPFVKSYHFLFFHHSRNNSNPIP